MSDESRTREAWNLLLAIAAVERARRPEICAALGVSEAQAEVLAILDPAAPTAMCRVAERLGCDPSNVTGIVRRLEARGLVERRADPADRRIRQLVLTESGRRLRRRLADRLAEAPPIVAALAESDQQTLCAILRRIVAGAIPPARPLRPAGDRRSH